MRICMLVRNSCVRDARVIREAAALAEAGHNVTVLATAEPGVPASESRDGFRIERVEPVPPWVRRLAGRPAVVPQTAVEGSGAARGPLRRRPWLVHARDRVVSARMGAAARARPADVFHAHDLNTLEAALAAARRRGAPVVYDSHELYPEVSGLTEPERRRWRRVEAALIGRAARVMTVSESLADELERRHRIARPLVLLNAPARPAGPPDPARSPLHALRREGEMLVVYTGALMPNRGLESLVDAAAEANGWRLAIMGWGRLESSLQARAPGVAFVPPVPPAEVVGACAAADVGVVPFLPIGLNNTLALPNKFFEYLHAGLALAVSDLVEMRRITEASGAGVVFEPGNVPAIAKALNELAAGPGALRAMRAGALKAAALYDWTNEKRKLVEVYATLARA